MLKDGILSLKIRAVALFDVVDMSTVVISLFSLYIIHFEYCVVFYTFIHNTKKTYVLYAKTTEIRSTAFIYWMNAFHDCVLC